MLVSSFKTYSPSALIKVSLFAVFLWVFSPLYHTTTPTKDVFAMPLFRGIAYLSNHFYYISALLSLIIHVFSAFLLNYIVNLHNVLSKKTYLPALLFLVYSSFCGELLILTPSVFANLLLIAACHELFNTYRKNSAALAEIFNAAALIGLASLLSLPALFLFLFVLVTLILYRPFIWQEYFVAFLGLLLPWVYFVVYYFWHNGLTEVWQGLGHNHLSSSQIDFPRSPTYIWLYCVLGTIAALSLLRLVNSHVVLPLKSKKTLSVLFWLLLFTIPGFLLNTRMTLGSLAPIAIPMAVFTSNLLLQLKKNWIAEMLFSFLLLSVVLVHFVLFLKR
jgi:hypothetical protein